MSDTSLPHMASGDTHDGDVADDAGDRSEPKNGRRKSRRKSKKNPSAASSSTSAARDRQTLSRTAVPSRDSSRSPELGSGERERQPLVSSQELYKRSAYVNVVLMSVAFFFVFLAFSGAQNFATSRNDAEAENLGGISLGIVYGVYAFSGFVASYIVESIGLKASFVVGGLAYTLFVATNIFYTVYFVIPASVVVGIGASVIWTAEGAFITWASQYHELINNLPEGSTLGSFNGIFWSIFQANQFVGNLLLAFLFNLKLPLETIFIVTTAIAFCGSMMFFFVRSLTKSNAYSVDQSRVKRYLRKKEKKEKRDSKRQQQKKLMEDAPTYAEVDGERINQNGAFDLESDGASSSSEMPFTLTANTANSGIAKPPSIFDAVLMWKDTALLLMLPVTIYSGFSQTFIFGEFPPLLIDESEKFYALAIFGFADMSFSMLLGKVSDRTGRLVPLAVGFVAHVFVYTYLLVSDVVPSLSDAHEFWVFACLAVLLGVGDAAYNTQIYAIFGTMFDSRAPVAFANFKIFQSGATAVGFFYREVVPFYVKLIVTLSWAVVGTLIVFVSKTTRKAAQPVPDPEDGDMKTKL